MSPWSVGFAGNRKKERGRNEPLSTNHRTKRKGSEGDATEGFSGEHKASSYRTYHWFKEPSNVYRFFVVEERIRSVVDTEIKE